MKHNQNLDKNWISVNDNNEQFPKYVISEINEVEKEYFECKDGKFILLNNNSFDEKIINPNKSQLIFVIGINSVFEVKKINNMKHDKSVIFIIEPSPSFYNYAVKNKDMKFLEDENVYLFVDSDILNIPTYFNSYFNQLRILELIQNSVFYFTEYYRAYEEEKLIDIIKLLKNYLRNTSLKLGNSIRDSLQGLEQNINNLKWLSQSKDSKDIKNKFLNVPAIIVSAGPSLNKNIEQLKNAKGNAVIIAVDTIAERLIEMDIVPDFICAIERVSEIYEYYFKEKSYPKEMSLVGPLLLKEEIFKEFNGELFLPFRRNVYEYEWLKEIVGITDNNHSIFMGSSCAHVALGWANHLGCSPIILAGQDLAYGMNDDETHATGTYHANNVHAVNRSSDFLTEGYYGKEVMTQKTWYFFKQQFEEEIFKMNMNVINATEGGAKIHHTKQQSLESAISQYCSKSIRNVYESIGKIKNFTFDMDMVTSNTQHEINSIRELKEKSLIQLSLMQKINIEERYEEEKEVILKNIENIDSILWSVISNKLYMHNLQPMILRYLWRRNEKERIISLENFKHDQEIQIEVLSAIVGTLDLIEGYLLQGINNLEEVSQHEKNPSNWS